MRFVFTTLALAVASCGSSSERADLDTSRGALSRAPLNNIDVTQLRQRISGFGASSAWTASTLSAAQADQLFSADKGLGLSLLRLRIGPDGSTQEFQTAQLAAQRGVAVWAAPWSPPGIWKTNESDTGGGSLLPEHYGDWANRLATFAAQQAQNGVPLFALSAQNEPNWTADWETCIWTPDDLLTFIRDYLAPALKLASPDTRVLAPESADWSSLNSFSDPILADSSARDSIGIVAAHAYGGTAREYPAVTSAGKEYWETEVSYNSDEGFPAAMFVAKMIHQNLTVAEVNAWHYWWLRSNTNASLVQNGVVMPQAYALGHYSKFVRPGFYRVDLAPNPSDGVDVSAFTDPASGRVVIVAINENASEAPQHFTFSGAPIGPISAWLTDADNNLEPQGEVANGSDVQYALPANSIVTLVADPLSDLGNTGGGGASASAGSPGEAGAPVLQAGSGGAAASEAGAPSEASAGTPSVAGASSEPSAGAAETPSAGGRESSGGASARGGTSSHAGGQTEGREPKQPFLPGCYCTLGVPAQPAQTQGALLGFSWLLLTAVARRRGKR